MEKIWMQFADQAMTQPCGWSWWEQSHETWPFQEQVALTDSRYVAYYDAMLPDIQTNAPAAVSG
jgi:hypothetical protein